MLLGRLGCPVPGGVPAALPDWPSRITNLPCLGRVSGLGNTVSFTGRKESSGLGGIASFPRRKASNYLGGTASFTGMKESSGLGGIASFPGRKVSNCLGGTASFPRGKVSSCRERVASFPWGKVSQSSVRGNAWYLIAYWGNSLGRTACFPRGKRSTCLTVSLGSVITFPWGEVLACLADWEPRLLDQIVALALVIFPCFLLIRILNLFNCLCLTLINLVSLTLLMKSWHSPNLSAEIIEASWVLQCSVCLVTGLKCW